MFFQENYNFLVRTVRGSFFAAKTEIFSRIENFPVRWNTAKNLKRANVSLRNFGYLITKHFAKDIQAGGFKFTPGGMAVFTSGEHPQKRRGNRKKIGQSPLERSA